MFAQWPFSNILYVSKLNASHDAFAWINYIFIWKWSYSNETDIIVTQNSFSIILVTFRMCPGIFAYLIFHFLLSACLPFVATHIHMVSYDTFRFVDRIHDSWVINVLWNNVTIYYKFLSALILRDEMFELRPMPKWQTWILIEF